MVQIQHPTITDMHADVPDEQMGGWVTQGWIADTDGPEADAGTTDLPPATEQGNTNHHEAARPKGRPHHG